MPEPKPDDHDFKIHVDPSCLNDAMDDETTPATSMSGLEDKEAVGDEVTKEDGQQTQTQDHTAEQDDKEPTSERDAQAGNTSRSSSSSRRVISSRTDALIHAAARSVVDQIERQRETDYNSCRESGDGDSIMSSAIGLGTELSYATGSDFDHGNGDHARRGSHASQSRHGSIHTNSRPRSVVSSAASAAAHDEDRAGDSSSHHEADSEVFSDRSNPSLRSSLGSSLDGPTSQKDAGDDHHRASKMDNHSSYQPLVHDEEHQHYHYEADSISQRSRSPRISEISLYEDHEEPAVPTIRGRARIPFRTPSDVRAIQLSSPAPSIFSGSPRSAKRSHLPTTSSRLGSPSAQTQYSPKNRTTPSRLKPRKVTPPLVLLHATLLPLRWPWASVLEAAPSEALSPPAKTLRDNWRRLHDRLGDTVCERGILLPHPQADYEVLQERLLEALDLPLRRRARILECGHYLGPANEHTLTEDLDSDGDGEYEHGYDYDDGLSQRLSTPSSSQHGRRSAAARTHWCTTCHHDIRFESLGPGKVFHVKTYASNGLMRAGAWAACWKEMERVDVEIEPIVEPDLLDELERLALDQQRDAEAAAQALTTTTTAAAATATGPGGNTPAAFAAASTPSHIETPARRTNRRHQGEPSYDEYLQASSSSSSPSLPIEDTSLSPSYSTTSRHDQTEERRRRQEARLREIYGQTPPPTANPSSPAPESRPPEPDVPHQEEPAKEPVEEPVEEPAHFSSSSYTPPSPSDGAQSRHETHQGDGIPHAPPPTGDPTATRNAQPAAPPSHLQTASFPELLLEAVRVLLQDRKNVALLLLSLLVLFLAVRPPTTDPRMREWDGVFAEPRQGPPAAAMARDGPGPNMNFDMDASVEKPHSVSISTSTTTSTSEPTVVASHEEHSQPPPSFLDTSSVVSASPDSRESQPYHDKPQVSVEDASMSQEEEDVSPKNEPGPSSVVQGTSTSREIVRIVETVTQTETIKAFVTESAEQQDEIPHDDSVPVPLSSSAASAFSVSSESDPVPSEASEEFHSSSETQSISSESSEEASPQVEVEVQVELDEEPVKEPHLILDEANVPDESPLDEQEEQQDQVIESQTDLEQDL